MPGGGRVIEGVKPSHGYSQYWEGGDWVFENELIDRDLSTKSPPRMCGEPCPQMYLSFGVVCGRDYDGRSREFDTYCDLRDSDCDEVNGMWIAHRGPCSMEIPVWPDWAKNITVLPDMLTRASHRLWMYNVKYSTDNSKLFDLNKLPQ